MHFFYLIPIVIGMCLLGTWLLQLLWNSTLPGLFNVSRISF